MTVKSLLSCQVVSGVEDRTGAAPEDDWRKQQVGREDWDDVEDTEDMVD